MIRILNTRCSPIGVDIGSHTVKLVQMNGDRSAVLHTARWEVGTAGGDDAAAAAEQRVAALRQAYQSRKFRGRDAVLSLSGERLFVQNIRVAKSPDAHLANTVHQEAAGKVPFPIEEAEIRYVDAGDIRHGDTTRREVILLACHRPVLEQVLDELTSAGLQPVAVDVEPAALLRCYAHQFRREEDQQQRLMYVHIGAMNTAVVIAQDAGAVFVKYLAIGGTQMNEAVARSLGMELPAAAMLRGHNGDRRKDQHDPEIARGVAQALRPVLDQLANELSLCIRYHSVTFRGQAIGRAVFGGGEATPQIAESVQVRLNLPCEVGAPFRTYRVESEAARHTQWDVATGLALRQPD